jgi:hypothetical protein
MRIQDQEIALAKGAPIPRLTNPQITESEHFVVKVIFTSLLVVGTLIILIPAFLHLEIPQILLVEAIESHGFKTSLVVLAFSICPILFDTYLDTAYGFASKKSEQDYMARVAIMLVISISTTIMIFDVKQDITFRWCRTIQSLSCIQAVFGNAVLFCLYHCDRKVFKLYKVIGLGIHMYMCVYLFIFINTYIYICIYIYVYSFIYKYTYIFKYTYTYTSILTILFWSIYM